MENKADNYYRQYLDADGKKLYDAIVDAFLHDSTDVERKGNNLFPNGVKDIVSAVILDHPEIFWMDYNHYLVASADRRVFLQFSRRMEKKESRELREELSAWRQEILSHLSPTIAKDDRIWMLCDYLARRVTYGDEKKTESHSVIGPMKHHAAVCEGIAKTFKFFCDGAKIPCRIVFGDVDYGPEECGPHAWNIVLTEQGAKHLDVTSELSFAHRKGKASEEDFLFSDAEMKAHYSWDGSRTPVCR